MRAAPAVLLALMGTTLLPGASAAQTQFRGLEVSVGYAGWTGDNVARLDPGVRTRLTLFGEAHRRLGVGLTGTWARVPLDLGGTALEGQDEAANEWGLGVTLRQALGDRDRIQFFIEGYAGWTQLGVDLGDDSPDVTENGLAIGPGIGVEIPMGSRLILVLGGDFHYYSYDQIEVEGAPGPDSDDAGWRYGFDLGLHLSTGS